MLLVMLCGTISASDYDFHVGGVYYRIIYVDGHPTTNLSVVEGDEKYSGDIVIPQSITVSNIDYPVTRIGHSAFAECPNLTSITFPSGINGKLTRIEPNAFQNCKGITSINIPNSVVLIDAYAFIGCSSLKSVTIGSGVKEIGNAAFNNCSSIERVDISDLLAWYDINFILYPGGYLGTSNPLYYAKHLYLNGNEVTELNIPDELTQIKPRAFINCEGLTSVKISNSASVTSIGESAFCGCRNIALVKLNNNLKEINRSAFYGCESIESLVIPDEVTLIADGAFQDCSKLKDLTLGKSVEIIGGSIMYGSAFGGTAITEITVPEKIQNLHGFWRSNVNTINIDKTALIDISSGNVDTHIPINRINITNLATFMNIKKQLAGYDLYLNGELVENVTIPSSIEDIKEYAMYNCKSLKTVTIPSHVKSIDQNVFIGCLGITKVLTNIQNPSAINYNVFSSETYNNAWLVVPVGTVETYKATNGWKNFKNIYEEGSEPPAGDAEPYVVYNDGTLTFYCDDQRSSRQGTTYELNERSTRPGWYENISLLNKVVFDRSFANFRPSSMYSWFANATNLTEIEGIQYLNTSSVTSMASTFYYCQKLSSIDVSRFDTEKVTNMSQMFDGCISLTNLDVSSFNTSSVAYMDFMFESCKELTNLNVSHFNTKKVVTMRGMFAGCQGLSSLDVSNFNTGVVKNMESMFRYCTKVTKLDVSKFNTSNVTNMAAMFLGCNALDNIDVSGFSTEKVTSMHFMFSHCSSLIELDLNSFDTNALVDIEKDCRIIGYHAIREMVSYCSKLSKVILGNGFFTKEELNCSDVFKNCTSLNTISFAGDIPASINSKFFTGVGTANAPATLVVPEQYKANYQAKFSGNQFYSGYFTMSNGEASGLKDGDTFTVKTVEGVEMTFKVISAADKTCQLGDGTKACIDTSTSGSFTIPAEVNGFRVNSVASWALYGCYGLNEIVISEGVESLMDNSIEQCNGVTSFVLPASVTSLSNTFGGVSSCLNSIKVAEGNPVYDSRNNCNAIIETASNVLRNGCVNTVIPSTVTAIGDWAMCNKNLTSISIPSSVKSIGDGALRYNPFKTVTIPESIENVGFCAFEECWYLEKVTIASKKCRLEGAAFANCGMLKTVVSYLESPEAVYRNIFYNSDDGATSEYILNDNVDLYVPFGTKTIYENTNGWKNFKNIVELNAIVGDVTGDGEVTKEDITEVETEILEPSEDFNPNKDVNRDGVVNVADIVEGNNIRNSRGQVR